MTDLRVGSTPPPDVLGSAILQIEPHMERDSKSQNLGPRQPRAMLQREQGVWVYQGEPTDISIADLIAAIREQRSRDILGLPED